MGTADEISQSCVTQAQHGRQLLARVAAVAADIAQTEQHTAAVLEAIASNAEPARADRLRAEARAARDFANRERREADHWAALSAERSK